MRGYSGGVARPGLEVGANWFGWREGVGRRGRLPHGMFWWGGCGVCVCVWEGWGVGGYKQKLTEVTTLSVMVKTYHHTPEHAIQSSFHCYMVHQFKSHIRNIRRLM